MPDFGQVRIYLDANILFSATHSRKNNFLELWAMPGVLPATSSYAIGEARRNMKLEPQRRRLNLLLDRTEVVVDLPYDLTPPEIQLVAKDRPILSAAIGSKCHYLVTGDSNHFGDLYGSTIEGVRVITTRDFRRAFEYRIDLDMLAYNFSEAAGW